MDKKIQELVNLYEGVVRGSLKRAEKHEERALGGVLRAEKGNLVETIATEMVKIAWIDVLGQSSRRLTIDKSKAPIPMKEGYTDTIENSKVRAYLEKNKKTQTYRFGTDVQVRVDGKFAIAVECKSYSENAMMKRIIFDANLMAEVYAIDKYYLVQLESQLGGDYSELNDITYGSPATNALLSRSNVPIEIITLVKGERRVKQPIHNPKFYKPINVKQIKKAIELFSNALRKFA